MLVQVEENIAKIGLDSKTKHTVDITVYKRNLRFKCKRCATFCCKLGGPNLTEKDVQRIREAGYAIDNFLEPATKRESNGALKMKRRLREKGDGSCIFLRFNNKMKVYKCSIYGVRPVLCRIYPFDFEKINHESFMLKFIPCCNGLNSPDGELVDEKFINSYLFDAVLEILWEVVSSEVSSQK